jgi:hypothetical protein
MKLRILAIIMISILTTYLVNAQSVGANELNQFPTEFKFDKNGFTDFVVINIPNKTTAELYKSTLEWVNVTYKNPKEVIKSQVENEYIRIEGIRMNMFLTKVLLSNFYHNGRYQIEISFKDGKYKFDVISLEIYISPSQYTAGGWNPIKIDNTKYYYKDNGELKSFAGKALPQEIESTFNFLNSDLKKSIQEGALPSKKSEW